MEPRIDARRHAQEAQKAMYALEKYLAESGLEHRLTEYAPEFELTLAAPTERTHHASFQSCQWGIQRWRSSSAMEVYGISVGVAQTGGGCGKASFAKSGPQIERPRHRRRERRDLNEGHAHVRARALARRQQRFCNKRFICV
jgi:hypothetical protein